MGSLTTDLYGMLPVAGQNLVCHYYGWREARRRLNRDFEAKLAALMESERWSRGEIEAYQDEQLRALVEHAYARVPFYRDRMRRLKLRPADVRSRADLPKLPILTKEDVRLHGDQLLAEGVRRRDLVAQHTSGTTGKSLTFYMPPDAVTFRWAVWWRHRVRFGVDVGDWHANFTGKLAVPPEQVRPPFWRWNRPMRQIVLNMHHMVPEKIESIVRFLDEQELTYYLGYPSVLHAFAQSVLDAGLTLRRKPRFVFGGAENMLEFQRADIAAVTGAVISDHYGFAEGCGNASRCTELLYHEDFEYGILECVDPEPAGDAGEVRGRIVATGFGSHAFPFIRYEVGDAAVWARDGFRCGCGRESTVLTAIDGRIEDYVVTPEGRRIMLFTYVFREMSAIKEAQVVQRRPGEIIVRVVRRPAYAAADERRLRSELARWISPRLEVAFEYVDEIPREPNGKFRAVKSELAGAAASAVSERGAGRR